MIQNLDWSVAGGPDGVQWETLFMKMANKPEYQLLTQHGNADLDQNLMDSYDLMTVLSGQQEQRGLQDAERVHIRLAPMFPCRANARSPRGCWIIMGPARSFASLTRCGRCRSSPFCGP